MRLITRCTIAGGLLVTFAGCQRRVPSWQEVALETGCTPELLSRTPAYDSSHVTALPGSYRLVRVDTARGWIEFEHERGEISRPDQMRLWAADSAYANWRRSSLSGKLVPANRPIAGILVGYEDKGFTADNPQIEINSGIPAFLTVQFSSQLVFDGALWHLPIERIGSWGFGGYFREGAYATPFGRDGRALDQRAGFYCSFRR